MEDTREAEKDHKDAKNCTKGCGKRHLGPFGKYCRFLTGEEDSPQQELEDAEKEANVLLKKIAEQRLRQSVLAQQEKLQDMQEELAAMTLANDGKAAAIGRRTSTSSGGGGAGGGGGRPGNVTVAAGLAAAGVRQQTFIIRRPGKRHGRRAA